MCIRGSSASTREQFCDRGSEGQCEEPRGKIGTSIGERLECLAGCESAFSFKLSDNGWVGGDQRCCVGTGARQPCHEADEFVSDHEIADWCHWDGYRSHAPGAIGLFDRRWLSVDPSSDYFPAT
jgi:hypothetical protein